MKKNTPKPTRPAIAAIKIVESFNFLAGSITPAR
jgi:hypothetical protein